MRPLGGIAGRELVGVDIQADRIKLAYAKIVPNRKEIAGLFNLGTEGKSADEITKSLKTWYDGLKAKNPQIISVIPPSQVITKNIEIPSTKPQEIEDIINLQAGRHTPFSREEIIVDHLVIGTYKNSYTKILLVIVARNVIKKQFEMLGKAGIKPEKVALASEALARFVPRAFKLDAEHSPISILQMGENSTSFNIAFKGRPIFVRNIPMGSRHIIGGEDANRLKFVEEIKRSLEAYQSEDIEKNPNMLVLTGAVDEIGGLQNVLNENIHIPSRIIPYHQNLAMSDKALETVSAAKRFSFLDVIVPLFTADELKVDLVPEEVKLRRALEERAGELIKTGIFMLTIFVLVFSVLISKIYFKSLYLENLKAEYKSLHQEAQELERSFTKVGVVKNYLTRRGYSLKILSELYNITPYELRLSDIRFDTGDRFSIKGTAESMSTVFSFVDNMEKSEYFKDVKTRYTTKRKEDDTDVTDFEIVSMLEK